ncbi:MAG: ribonuclease HII [Alphaproteobacteria bacterium]|nr:ribonuclease HII [Alphaproteobacteria bacterium]
MPDFSLEATLPAPVAGVDEAGRGPLAGPVFAAAVVLDPARAPAALLASLDDSKKLAPSRRAALDAALRRSAGVRFAVAEADVGEIDRLNILQATMLAMRRALEALDPPPAGVLVDGNRVPRDLAWPARAAIGGDGRSLSIAAASILAKVARDARMATLARAFPGYGWETNQGYGSAAHLDALRRLGPTPHHRASFAPVADALNGIGRE